MRKSLLSMAAWSARILPAPLVKAIYRLKPLAALIRRALNRAAPLGLSEVTIAAGDLAGLRLRLNLQVDKDYWLGTYEPELQHALRKLVPAGAVAYDVGANIGYVSLLLAKAAGPQGRVIAFEALPANQEQLHINVKLNGMEERITIVPAAVTRASGEVTFLVHDSPGMGKAAGSAGRTDEYRDEIRVQGISLDEFVYQQGNPPPSVIKMDIEGGEVMALPGMPRLLREHHPLMLMELHGPDSARVAWESLGAAGYQICWMRKGFPVVPSLQEMGWKAYIVARWNG